MSLRVESSGPAETKKLGQRLAPLFQPGDVVLLQGELGAGKTCLAQGIGRGLQVREPVKSSSFVLVNEYHGRLNVYHADLFRLNDPSEVAELGLEENAQDGLLLIEWPERAHTALAAEHLKIVFQMNGPKSRSIEIVPVGARYEALIEVLTKKLGVEPS